MPYLDPHSPRALATHRERQARYRASHPIVAGNARNPDRLTAAEKHELRTLGLDPSSFRAETGRPYVLYGGSEGPELYCSDGYLQGEPCPHGCWSI